MNAPPQVRLSSAALVISQILLGGIPTVFAASAAAALDSGGKRVSSARYCIDGSLGSLGGIVAAVSPQVIARYGYVGQLCDLQSIVISASTTTVEEAGTSQLSVQAIFDDSTFLSLPTTGIAWRVVSGPIASINACGLVTASNVYQDTAATVRADYQSIFNMFPLTVINVGTDDFGLYAHDGIDDAWQVRYFGLNNPQAGPSSDSDGDGVRNEDEYIADTNPTNALSFFHILSLSNAVGFAVYFPSITNQSYTLLYASNLTTGGWGKVPSQTTIRMGEGLQGLLDSSPLASQRFYRIVSGVPNLSIQSISRFNGWSASFVSSTNRIYTLYYRTNLTFGAWTNVPSQTGISGGDGVGVLTDPSPAGTHRYYRIGVSLP